MRHILRNILWKLGWYPLVIKFRFNRYKAYIFNKLLSEAVGAYGSVFVDRVFHESLLWDILNKTGRIRKQ